MYIYTSNPIHVHTHYDIKSIFACSFVFQLILNYTVVSWDVSRIQFKTPLFYTDRIFLEMNPK